MFIHLTAQCLSTIAVIAINNVFIWITVRWIRGALEQLEWSLRDKRERKLMDIHIYILLLTI